MISIDLFLLPLNALNRRVPMVGPIRYPRPAHPSLPMSDRRYRQIQSPSFKLEFLETRYIADATHVAPPYTNIGSIPSIG